MSQYNVTGLTYSEPNSPKTFMRQMISHNAKLILLYSDSFEYLETVFCFLTFHDFPELPNRIQKPVTDFLVSTHPTQSKSQKPRRIRTNSEESKIPLPGSHFTYIITLSATSKCYVFGSYIY